MSFNEFVPGKAIKGEFSIPHYLSEYMKCKENIKSAFEGECFNAFIIYTNKCMEANKGLEDKGLKLVECNRFDYFHLLHEDVKIHRVELTEKLMETIWNNYGKKFQDNFVNKEAFVMELKSFLSKLYYCTNNKSNNDQNKENEEHFENYHAPVMQCFNKFTTDKDQIWIEKKKLLEKEISFQGQLIPLRSILKNNNILSENENILYKQLLGGKVIKIGKEQKEPEFYIDRRIVLKLDRIKMDENKRFETESQNKKHLSDGYYLLDDNSGW